MTNINPNIDPARISSISQNIQTRITQKASEFTTKVSEIGLRALNLIKGKIEPFVTKVSLSKIKELASQIKSRSKEHKIKDTEFQWMAASAKDTAVPFDTDKVFDRGGKIEQIFLHIKDSDAQDVIKHLTEKQLPEMLTNVITAPIEQYQDISSQFFQPLDNTLVMVESILKDPNIRTGSKEVLRNYIKQNQTDFEMITKDTFKIQDNEFNSKFFNNFADQSYIDEGYMPRSGNAFEILMQERGTS